MTDTQENSADTVRQALAGTPVIDGHNDLPTALRARSGYSVEGLDKVRTELHTDLPRLRAGGVGAQFWSVYVPSSLPEPEAVVSTLEQIDAVYRLAARYPDDFRIAYTSADIEAASPRAGSPRCSAWRAATAWPGRPECCAHSPGSASATSR
jgi:membrane dipeptidase